MQFLDATNDVFSGLTGFLQQIDYGRYNRPVEYLQRSTIGQHTRHTIEFFQCLLKQSGSGVVNYDKRERNNLMETHPAVALKVIEQIAADFANMPIEKSLILETSFSEREDDFSLVPSSFSREWSYVLEHAIHHMAIIKVGLKMVAPEIKVPDNFGVGPATVRYRQRQCAP